MSATIALVRHSLRRSRHILVVVLAVLAGFELILTVSANAAYETGSFRNFAAMIPPFIRQMFGDSLIGFLSYSGLVAFGYFHPVIIGTLAAVGISAATETVGDVETRFLDIVLARPIPRGAVLARSALLAHLLPALAIAVMAAFTLASVRYLAPTGAPVPSTSLVISLALNLWAVMACIGGVALAVAAASRRRSTAAGVVAVIMVALFLLDYVSRVWKPATHVVWLSPFHYFDAMALVMGAHLSVYNLAVLLITGGAGTVLGFVLFSRRDL